MPRENRYYKIGSLLYQPLWMILPIWKTVDFREFGNQKLYRILLKCLFLHWKIQHFQVYQKKTYLPSIPQNCCLRLHYLFGFTVKLLKGETVQKPSVSWDWGLIDTIFLTYLTLTPHLTCDKTVRLLHLFPYRIKVRGGLKATKI